MIYFSLLLLFLLQSKGLAEMSSGCWARSWQKLSTFFLQFRYRSDLMGMKGTGWLALRSPQMESTKKAGELISEVPAARPPQWCGQSEYFLLNRDLVYTVEIIPRWTQGLMDSKRFVFFFFSGTICNPNLKQWYFPATNSLPKSGSH